MSTLGYNSEAELYRLELSNMRRG